MPPLLDEPITHGSTRAVRAVLRTADALLAVLLAPTCAACGALLEHPSHSPVCDRCWDAVQPFAPPLCGRCGRPLRSPNPQTRACCPGRSDAIRSIDSARAIGPYDGALREIIAAMKYRGCPRIAGSLGRLLRHHADAVLTGANLAVAVPLHRHRERQRGFNQSAIIAAQLGLPMSSALRRTRETLPQALLPAGMRRTNVRGAFALAPGEAGVRGRVVVLVDDVWTTGATLDACAWVLKDAGAREVRALTVARVAQTPR
jgi:ComF family protein